MLNRARPSPDDPSLQRHRVRWADEGIRRGPQPWNAPRDRRTRRSTARPAYAGEDRHMPVPTVSQRRSGVGRLLTLPSHSRGQPGFCEAATTSNFVAPLFLRPVPFVTTARADRSAHIGASTPVMLPRCVASYQAKSAQRRAAKGWRVERAQYSEDQSALAREVEALLRAASTPRERECCVVAAGRGQRRRAR